MDDLLPVLGPLSFAAPRLGRVRHASPWRLAPSEGAEGLEVHVVLQGSGEIRGPGEAPRAITVGDVVLLRGLTARGDEGSPRLAPRGAGDRVETVVARYRADTLTAPEWVTALPTVAHAPANDAPGDAARGPVVALIRDEIARGKAAQDLVVARLFDVLLVALARAHLRGAARATAGASLDARIARVLAALDGRPAEPWTIARMAKLATMSRAAFVLRFTAVTGAAPHAYLMQLRMRVAGALLRETDDPAATIAIRVGYGSPYAFSRAFKRLIGVPPAAYRRGQRSGVPIVGHRTTAMRLAA